MYNIYMYIRLEWYLLQYSNSEKHLKETTIMNLLSKIHDENNNKAKVKNRYMVHVFI